ncbi:MAG TPA: twin-arginine translocase TatA/TatE family subunit [Candidatus Microbacterium stercoravium]|uniref:Sec-independent protein translocase protein TatA n=1 Tax=Candidatus Microbacterium stercoravium TaxID=2838697 RepID=A0A9D2H2Q0_9MICO|nr:twin-arginine translocase TatA/TatE family subunit [Candidatus Microbacterium stercoravium]
MHLPGGVQILLILVVILLIFGASRLPALAKSMGQSARVFKSEMKQMKDDGTTQSEAADDQNGSSTASSSTAAPSPTEGASPDTPKQ